MGTPPVVALAALDAALDVWDGVSIEDVRARSMELGDLFIAEVEGRCPELEFVGPPLGPRSAARRCPSGSSTPGRPCGRSSTGASSATSALPDVMRFGIAPLYLDAADMIRAAEILAEIVAGRLWDQPRFRERRAVT